MQKFSFTAVAVAALLAAPVLAHAAPRQTVAAGSDYFQTQPGTQFNFGPTIGVVDFLGDPFGPGLTDTIVQRQADALINGPAIPIQIVGLQLVSTAPVNIGAFTGPIFVSLDPAHLGQDTGTMSIAGNTSGGTFNSFFDVFFDVCTAIGVDGVGCGFGMTLATNNVVLTNSGASWLPTPAPGTVLVNGAFGDQLANVHSGLPCNVDECEVDFFVVPPLVESSGAGAHHVVDPAPIPEPVLVSVFGAGIAGLVAARRRRQRRSA